MAEIVVISIEREGLEKVLERVSLERESEAKSEARRAGDAVLLLLTEERGRRGVGGPLVLGDADLEGDCVY